MNHAKNAKFDDVYNQLIFAYKDLDVKLKQMLNFSTREITMKNFMKKLKQKKWFDLSFMINLDLITIAILAFNNRCKINHVTLVKIVIVD